MDILIINIQNYIYYKRVMEKQVLTIKQMKELHELNINTSKASMIWEYKGHDNEYKDYYNLEIFDYTWEFVTDYDVPTFTLQDIFEMIPKIIYFKDEHEANLILSDNSLIYYEISTQMICLEKRGKTMLEAAFNMLKWLKENGHI